jgi:PAS domain S-box-containing protein
MCARPVYPPPVRIDPPEPPFLEPLRPEDALRASEARFRELIDAAPDAVTVTVDGRLVWVNRACVEMFGHASAEDLLARPLSDLLPSPELARVRQHIEHMLSTGERLPPAEYVATRADGTLISVEVVSLPFTMGGQPAILSFARDLRERKRMQLELMQADRMAAVGTLAAGVAHEINNPLTYVLLHLARLRQRLPGLVADPAERDEAARLLDEASEGGERVRVIVRDLLTFSRSEVIEREPVEVVQVIESTLKLAATSIRHRARLEAHLEPLPPIQSSRARLGQIVLNLVVNAGQAFDEDEPGRNLIAVGLRRIDGDRLSITVRDNGPGAPPEHLDRLFDPFFTTKMGGTGLGLTITRTIVEQLGGTIAASNQPGGGMTFEVVLPMRPGVPSAPPPFAEVTERGRRVVVVEDEERLAGALASLLGDVHHVELFGSSHAALEHLSGSAEVDLVLCDLVMDGLSGAELYHRVCAARPELADRFVFMSGGAPPPAVRELIARRGVPLLAKPFDVDQVWAVLAQRLGTT